MTQHSSKRNREELPSNWLQQLKIKVKRDGQKAGMPEKKINQLLNNFEKSLQKTQPKGEI